MNIQHPHRYDLSTDPDGFMSGVAEEVSIDRNGLSLPFVSPACIVPKHNRRVTVPPRFQ